MAEDVIQFPEEPTSTTTQEAQFPSLSEQPAIVSESTFPRLIPETMKQGESSNPDIRAERAAKYSFGMNSDQYNEEYFNNNLAIPGAIESDRRHLSDLEAIQNAQQRREILEGLVRNAAREGRKLNQAEIEVASSLTQADIREIQRDPETFFERKFAQRVVATLEAQPVEGDDDAQNGMTQNYEIGDVFEDQRTRVEGFHRLAQDEAEELKKQSYLATGVEVLASALPGLTWYSWMNVVKDAAPVSFLPGSNRLEQIEYLHTLPPEEGVKQAKAAIEEIKRVAGNLEAAQFAQALTSYSSSAAFWDNAFIAGADIATLPLGAVARGAVRGASAATKAAINTDYRNLAKVLSNPKASLADVAAASGDVALAAGQTVQKRLTALVRGSGRRADTLKEAFEQTVSFGNYERLLNGAPIQMAGEAARRIVDNLQYKGAQLVNGALVEGITTGLRWTPAALRAATDEALEVLQRQYRNINDAVLDVSHTDPERSIGGIPQAIIGLGNINGKLFATRGMARRYAENIYNLPKGSYNIKTEGNAHWLELTRPLDFSSEKFRDVMRTEVAKEAATTQSLIGNLLIGLRTGDDVFSERTRQAIKNATIGGSKLANMLSKASRKVGKQLKKKDFRDFIRYQQTYKRPDDIEGVFGKYSTSIGEMEQDWLAQFNRLPTEAEVEAYFDYVLLNDIEYMSRNMSLYLEEVATGHMEFNLAGVNGVVGKVQKELPGRDTQHGAHVLVMDGDTPYLYYTKAPATPGKDNKRALELMNTEGYTVVNLSRWGTDKLMDGAAPEVKAVLNGRPPSYVVVKEPQSTPLSFNRLPYSPGGHHMTPQGYFVSVAQVNPRADGTAMYYGDRNLFWAHNEKNAREIAQRFDTARRMLNDIKESIGATGRITKQQALLKRGDFTELKKYVEENLPISWRQFRNLYIKDGGKYRTNHPVVARSSQQSALDANDLASMVGSKQGVIKFSNSEHDPYRNMVNLQYTQERGETIGRIESTGTVDNPEFGIVPGEVIDPFIALDRSLRSMANTGVFNEAKIVGSNEFLTNFGDLLDMAPAKQALDPITAMMKAPFKQNVQGEDVRRLRMAKAFRGRMQQFFNVKDDANRHYDYLAEKLLGGVSPDLARGWRAKLHDVLTDGDPWSKLKSLAFYPKMGFFNLKQLFLQAQTFAHMAAISPTNAPSAGVGAILQHLVSFADLDDLALVQRAGRMYNSLGLGSVDEFVEMTTAMRRAGWDIVGREVALREAHSSAGVMRTKWGEFLDWGLMPFRNGEEFVRRSAFNIAYKEWKKANPNKTLRDADIPKLVDRADLLNVNMTQASNASWQQGWTSIPTQFWAYQIRLTEQLLGKRLTRGEKTRIMLGYSTLYGIPIAASAAAVYPVHENIRKYMTQFGITNPNETAIGSFLNQGVLGSFADFVFGEDVNAETVFGPSGLPFLEDIFSGDKTILEILGGASGNVLFAGMAEAAPILGFGLQAVNPISNVNLPPPTMSDFTDIFTKTITTLGQAEKIYIAETTGNFINRHGEVVAPGNEGVKAWFQALLGIQPQNIEDIYAALDISRNRDEVQRTMRRRIFGEMRKLYAADTLEEMQYYQRRIQVMSGSPIFTPVEATRLYGDFVRQNRPLIERAIARHRNNPDLQAKIRDSLR